jgi:hypothetical protein
MGLLAVLPMAGVAMLGVALMLAGIPVLGMSLVRGVALMVGLGRCRLTGGGRGDGKAEGRGHFIDHREHLSSDTAQPKGWTVRPPIPKNPVQAKQGTGAGPFRRP